eukprot:COSAG03_NODE_1192_length_4606_cov_3.085645_2_plen_259_part_00
MVVLRGMAMVATVEAERGRRVDGLGSLADGVGSAMAGRRAFCWLLFRSAGTGRCGALDDARRRGCAPRRGLHRGCSAPRLVPSLTTIGCACGGYRWAYGARRAASAAAQDERVCRALLLTGLPQVRPHMRRDGPMCCSIARRLLPPSSIHSFPTGRRLAWCASQWQELRGRLLHSSSWETWPNRTAAARASRPAIFIAAFSSSAPDHDQLRPTASLSRGFAHIAVLCLRLCFTGAASGAICRLLLTTAGVTPQSDSNR